MRYLQAFFRINFSADSESNAYFSHSASEQPCKVKTEPLAGVLNPGIQVRASKAWNKFFSTVILGGLPVSRLCGLAENCPSCIGDAI